MRTRVYLMICGNTLTNIVLTSIVYIIVIDKKDLNAYINIKMDSSDLESNTKVVQNQILNKIKSTSFQFGRGLA